MEVQLHAIFEAVDALRERLKVLRAGLNETQATQQALEATATLLESGVDALLTPIDEAGRLLSRNVKYLQALSQGGTQDDLGTLIRVTNEVLTSSIRLARGIFPPERLHDFDWGDDMVLRDVIRIQWGDWLRLLNQYLLEAIPLAASISTLPGSEATISSYSQSLLSVCRQAEQLARQGRSVPADSVGMAPAAPAAPAALTTPHTEHASGTGRSPGTEPLFPREVSQVEARSEAADALKTPAVPQPVDAPVGKGHIMEVEET
ncbi:MAG TPA: hypothetical protein VF826_16975 [Chloroflexia bacterium]